MIDQVFANFSFTYVFLFLFLSFCLYYYYIVVRNDREINALGARAPIIKSYVPFGKAQFSNSIQLHLHDFGPIDQFHC
jgi:hypothetical protein